MKPAYYNEFEPYAAQWLRNLIKAGHIPDGEVDERSIVDVDPADLRQFRQCHFFAGIGGWPLALRLAGWPDDREIWTGSPPCQPFSVAGKQEGFDDSRDLWPVLAALIRERRPAAFMGEQVAAAIAKHWLDRMRTDLEAEGYAVGASVQPACAVNAPHRRDRLWIVAHAAGEGWGQAGLQDSRDSQAYSRQAGDWFGDASEDGSGHVADTSGIRRNWREGAANRHEFDRKDARRLQSHGLSAGGGRDGGFWSESSRISGYDGKARRVEPSIRLLAHGVPARVGRLRAYGNAIVPQVAAEVIGAFMECRP